MTQKDRDWLFNVSYKLQNQPRFKDNRGFGKQSIVLDSEVVDTIADGMRSIASKDEDQQVAKLLRKKA